jgi:hypothetical protein
MTRLLMASMMPLAILEGEADAVGAAGLEFGAGEAVELGALALRQVGRVLEPEITAVLQLGAGLLFGPAHLLDGLVNELDEVEVQTS